MTFRGIRDVDVQIRPQSPKAAPRSFWGVLALERVHKIQHFLLLLRGQFAELFEDLSFEGHSATSQHAQLYLP
jgi:hypothetical protein